MAEVKTALKCAVCGRFVAYKDVSFGKYIPDNAFGPEVIEHLCPKHRRLRMAEIQKVTFERYVCPTCNQGGEIEDHECVEGTVPFIGVANTPENIEAIKDAVYHRLYSPRVDAAPVFEANELDMLHALLAELGLTGGGE